MKPSIEMIVGKLPPPGKLPRRGGTGDGTEDPVAPNDPESPERADYNAAEDSMAAFAETLKGSDTVKQLDAFLTLMKTAEASEPGE